MTVFAHLFHYFCELVLWLTVGLSGASVAQETKLVEAQVEAEERRLFAALEEEAASVVTFRAALGTLKSPMRRPACYLAASHVTFR